MRSFAAHPYPKFAGVPSTRDLCLFFGVCSFITLIQNKIMRLQNPCGISIIDAFTALYWIIPDLPCQKRLWVLFFCDVNHNLKKRREPPGKRKPVVCDWWISIRFVYLCVSRLVALFLKSTVSFTLVQVFLTSLY